MNLKMLYIYKLLIWIISVVEASYTVLNLNGNWTLFCRKISVPAVVPGCIYTDLQNSGVIGNPLYRTNDIEYSWVGLRNWSYIKRFTVSEKFIQLHGIDLICNGLDTVALIIINGIHIGSANNMHRRYIFSIKDVVKIGVNYLNITFISPVLYKSEERVNYPYNVPPEPYFNFIRKAAYSFGWDWGPSFPSVGIWRDIYIEGYEKFTIRNVKIQTFSDGNDWELRVTSYFDIPNEAELAIAQVITIKELNITRKELFNLSPSVTKHDTHIKLEQNIVELWWPNGIGNAKLYEVKIDICDKSECPYSKYFYIGFRQIELIQESVNYTHGLTFYFKINGIPIFCKGSNWIPAGNFQGSVDETQVEWLLKSVADANMNILRVWGGGIYETERFYDLADKLGIMIWQDFMFACAFYPTNVEFLENVRGEIIYQVRRLSRHPSIIIWSGNNENEVALADNWFNIPSEMMETFRQDYIELYIKYIRNIILHEDLSRPYITSSPSNGLKTMTDEWLSSSPQDEEYGDIHFYNYSVDGWNPGVYRIPRFASEFGFQSWPSFETLQPVSLPEDLHFDSNFSAHRQRHSNGNLEIKDQMDLHIQFLWGENKTKDFVMFIYMSQITQAMSVKTQVEHYRRYQLSLLRDGRGKTMGAMYWQLNDVWQAPTWSSIEYGGKWKILHYYAQKFFSVQMVSAVLHDGLIAIYFVKDHQLDLECADFILSLQCFNFNKFLIVRKWNLFFHQVDTVNMVYQEDLNFLMNKCGCLILADCFLEFQVLSTCDNKIVSENFLFFDNYLSNIPIAYVTVEDVIQKDKFTLDIIVQTNNFALFVWLEALTFTGKFSENGFHMTNTSHKITYISVNPVFDISSFHRSLKITCLSDINDLQL